MRLAPASPEPVRNPVAGFATLDEVLAHNAVRDPEGLALVAAGLPFLGTWAETDRAVSALAEAFIQWRLGADAIVGVQLGSSAEAALVSLALWRAGLIPALLPLAWRRREVAAALNGVGGQAIVAHTRAADGRPAEQACEAAIDLDRLRFIATFGPGAPDGATPLDDLLDAPAAAVARADRPDDAADHVAAITFDAGAVPVARSHNELVAAGLMPLLAAKLSGGDRLLSTLDLAGLPGLATGLAPWLVTRATATFHQPSTTAAFAAAARALKATHVAAPGRALERLIADGALEGVTLAAITAVWRAPDPRGAGSAFGAMSATLVDVIAFGEVGLVAAARTAPTRALATPLGGHAPEGLDTLIETHVASDGRFLVRGPVCPSAAFASPQGAALAIGPDGFVETGLVGVADRVGNRVSLGGRRRGALQIGGLALAQSDAEDAFAAVGLSGHVDAQDDPTLGARVRLTLAPGADAVSAEDAAAALEEAGYGAALAPRTVVAEPARRTA